MGGDRDVRVRLLPRAGSVAVEHLTVFHGNGFTGPDGAARGLALPPAPSGGRSQPWVRGGRNNVGEEYDGPLPDPYTGIESVLALMKARADAAHAGGV